MEENEQFQQVIFDISVQESHIYGNGVYTLRDINGNDLRPLFTHMCKMLGAKPGDNLTITMCIQDKREYKDV